MSKIPLYKEYENITKILEEINKPKPKVIAIIQARMASTRLPGKVLLPLGPKNKPVLWWLFYRIGLAELVDQVVVATTNNPVNQPIMDFADHNHKGWYVYGYDGEEDDVIGRVISCAKFYDADIVVDITGDCPMVDPRHIDHLVNYLLITKTSDYVSNDVIHRSWPDGLDVQVYWLDTLMKCQRRLNPKQHCGYNIGSNSLLFNVNRFWAPVKYHWPELGLTLDTSEDYKFLQRIFNYFGDYPGFMVEHVIDFLRENPDWITNKDVKRKDPTKEG